MKLSRNNTEFSPRQIELLKERLSWFVRDQGMSLRKLIETLLLCESVGPEFPYDEPETKGKEKWDAYLPLKEEITRRFLNGQTASNKVHLDAYKDFLIHHEYLSREEFLSSSNNFSDVNKIITYVSAELSSAFFNNFHTSVFFRFRQKNSVATLISVELPTSKAPSALVNLDEIKYLRGGNEKAIDFQQRIQRGDADSHKKWKALAIPQKNDVLQLQFIPINGSLRETKVALLSPRQRGLSVNEIALFYKTILPKLQHNLLLSKSNLPNLKNIIKNAIVKVDKKQILFSIKGQKQQERILDIEGDLLDKILGKYGIMENKEELERNNKLLILAAHNGASDDILKSLVNGADINTVEDSTGQTAAHICASNADTYSLGILYASEDEMEDILLRDSHQLSDMGDNEFIIGKWKDAIDTFDPLIRDKANDLASNLFPLPDLSVMSSIEMQQKYEVEEMIQMHARIVRAEMIAMEERGNDPEDLFKQDYKVTQLTKSGQIDDENIWQPVEP